MKYLKKDDVIALNKIYHKLCENHDDLNYPEADLKESLGTWLYFYEKEYNDKE